MVQWRLVVDSNFDRLDCHVSVTFVLQIILHEAEESHFSLEMHLDSDSLPALCWLAIIFSNSKEIYFCFCKMLFLLNEQVNSICSYLSDFLQGWRVVKVVVPLPRHTLIFIDLVESLKSIFAKLIFMMESIRNWWEFLGPYT